MDAGTVLWMVGLVLVAGAGGFALGGIAGAVMAAGGAMTAEGVFADVVVPRARQKRAAAAAEEIN